MNKLKKATIRFYGKFALRGLFLLFLFSSVSLYAIEIPKLTHYCNDFTGTLTRAQVRLFDNVLREFEEKTSNQIVFLMINSLEGYPIEEYAIEVAEKNKIGTKEHDNGVLFVVAKLDRKMRIEVGYGLEGALTDALASSILRNEVRPYFKRGDYFNGIAAGLDAIMKATVGEYKNTKRKRVAEEGEGISIGGFIFFLIILFLIFGGGGRGGGLGWFFLGSMLGGGSRGYSGGGLGGGAFGGFSGGGGSFGGGGASGGW